MKSYYSVFVSLWDFNNCSGYLQYIQSIAIF